MIYTLERKSIQIKYGYRVVRKIIAYQPMANVCINPQVCHSIYFSLCKRKPLKNKPLMIDIWQTVTLYKII